jgi:hypothetical protein
MLAAFPSPNLSSLSVAGTILHVFADQWRSLSKSNITEWASLEFFYAVNVKLHAPPAKAIFVVQL